MDESTQPRRAVQYKRYKFLIHREPRKRRHEIMRHSSGKLKPSLLETTAGGGGGSHIQTSAGGGGGRHVQTTAGRGGGATRWLSKPTSEYEAKRRHLLLS